MLFIVWTPSNVLLPVVAKVLFEFFWDDVKFNIEELKALKDAVSSNISAIAAFVDDV